MNPRPPVFLGLGSNVGDREATLESALRRLGERSFAVSRVSSLYETEPVGGPPQGWFLNAVARGETALSPEELLDACLGIERELGRVRDVPCGPRTLDLDILFYGSEARATPSLTVPHPRLHERRFVLVPLAELDPAFRHPLLGRTAAELLAACPDASRVIPHQPTGARA